MAAALLHLLFVKTHLNMLACFPFFLEYVL